MAKSPPERLSFSIPDDEELDRETIDELVRRSGYSDRSALIRAAIEQMDETLDPD